MSNNNSFENKYNFEIPKNNQQFIEKIINEDNKE
jgi:hypothetical protein